MKTIQIVISANVPDNATDDEIRVITENALVQVMEPADEEGMDLDWSPVSFTATATVNGNLITN